MKDQHSCSCHHADILAPAQAVELSALVSYQAGSIVSCTLAKGDAGTVTLFAFDRGQALSEHTAPFDALVLVVEGEARLTIGGAPVAVRAGEIVRMPGNVPHAVEAVERLKMLLVMLRDNPR